MNKLPLILTLPKTTQKNNRSRCRIYWQCGESSSRQRSIIHEVKQVPLRLLSSALHQNESEFMRFDSWFDVFPIKISMHVIKKKIITIWNRILVYTSFHNANGNAVKVKLQHFDNCEMKTLYFINMILYFINMMIRIDDKKLKCAISNKHDGWDNS